VSRVRRSALTKLPRFILRKSFLIGAGTVALLSATALTWYFQPVRIEEMDRLRICNCGFSTVKFEDGKIQAFKTVHNDIPPGTFIGTYARNGNTLDLSLQFKGKSYRSSHKIDHLGVQLGMGPWPEMYYIIRDDSPKLYIHHFIQNCTEPLKDAKRWVFNEFPWFEKLGGGWTRN
jgi:hypothetical protein